MHNDNLDEEFKKMDFGKLALPWPLRLLLRWWPTMAMRYFARKQGIINPFFDKAHELFAQTERIDILPTKSGVRGFVIVLNSQTALYFNQAGDHFSYDGYEMGEYDPGDVTIFDNVKTP